jgi:NADH:ubiquinone oxidoreductase subunit E
VSNIESADIPWSEAVVMVCTKCSRKIVGDESLADSIKKTLKHSFKEAGFGKNVRSVTSSCLDICPKDRVAIAIVRRHAGTRAITVDPKIDDQSLFTEVKTLAVPST